MQPTGKSHGDDMVAATVALAVNGLIAWHLQAMLAPHRIAPDNATPLKVVWIAAAPRRPVVVAATARHPTTIVHAPSVEERAMRADAHAATPPLRPADPTLARPMTAVYLQQAGQWAQDHPVATAPADPFADRRVPLRDQAASRFRLKRPLSVADAVAMVGVAFGSGPHPCERNPDDVAGYATGGDALALQMALDVERHCRP